MSKQEAFTLMELLVVLAIIAILASIIFPTLAWGRKRARQTTCLSNLRQCGVALKLYMDDNATDIPPDAQAAAGQLAKMPTCCSNDVEWTKGCTQPYGQPLIGSYAYTRSVFGWSKAPYDVVSKFYQMDPNAPWMVDLFHGNHGIPAPLHDEGSIAYSLRIRKSGQTAERSKLPDYMPALYSDGHCQVRKLGVGHQFIMSWGAIFEYTSDIEDTYLGREQP